MSITTKTILAAAALVASGIATATKPVPVATYMGVENRDGLVGVPVCAKADLTAGVRYFWTEDQTLRAALVSGSKLGCFKRLGRDGDMGYSQAGVTLIREGGNTYRAAVNGKPAGQALRALVAPKEVVPHAELNERSGVVALSGYSGTGNMTQHSVKYEDGTRDVIRRVGETERLAPGTHVVVARAQLDADNYWLTISNVTK